MYMQSYVPIAPSVLGNCCFRVRDRVNLARSLSFSRLLFNVHVWSSLSQWAVRRLNGCLHEGAPKSCGAAKIQSWKHARDHLLHFAEHVVLPGPTCERTSRHFVKPVECELPAPLSSWSNKIWCSSGLIDKGDPSGRLKTSSCSSVGPAAYVLKATQPSGAMSGWLTRREHL